MADENQGKRGWGGKRPGAGRKKLVIDNSTGREVTPQAGPTVPAIPKQRQPMFSPDSVEAIISAFREMQSKRSARQRGPDWNPYIIRPDRFGPAAVEAKAAKMAMDDNTALMSANQFAVTAWQSGGMMGSDASEGMLFLGYSHLSQLLQRPEFRLFGEIMSEEMTRKWIDFRGTDDESTKEKGKPKPKNDDDKEAETRRKANGDKPRSDDKNKEIERKVLELKDFAEEIKLRQIFKTIAAHDSGFGIGHLYVDLKGADIDNLRDPENRLSIGNGRDEASKAKLGKNCLQGLRVIEPIWCYPTSYNASNPLSPNWYDPDVWYVMGAEIHKTRLIPFIGRPVPDILKPAYAFGGLPMTQMAQPYVDIWLRTRESVAEIIHAFSIMVLSTDLGTTTQPGGAGGGNGDIIARMMLANMLRDNQGMMVIDKSKEDFKNIAAPISGLDELQAQSQEHMFSVGRIPGVKFAGITPKGLNASSEGELRAFNDTVHGQQEHLFRPGLTTIVDIMQISLWGHRDPDITLDFLPLYEETQKEKAEIRKLEAETDQIRIDSGVVSQEEVRSKVAADPESGFHGLDPDDVPDLLGEEEEGLIPEGAGKGLEAEIENGGAGPEKPPAGGRKPGAKPSGQDGMPSIAAGIVHRAPDGSVLLLRRSQAEGNYKGHWALPGGKADDGETPESAALRENGEEIGKRPVGALRKIDEVDTPNGMKFHTFLHETARFEPRLNDEHDGFMWAHPSRLPEPMHPAVKRIVGNLPEVKGGQDDGAADAWNEGDHPRGQPENAGQFGPGGGGSKPAKVTSGGEGSTSGRSGSKTAKAAPSTKSGRKRATTLPATSLLKKKPIAGSNYRQALVAAIKGDELTQSEKKAAAENLVLSWMKTQQNYRNKGDEKTVEKIGAKIIDIAQEHGLDFGALVKQAEAPKKAPKVAGGKSWVHTGDAPPKLAKFREQARSDVIAYGRAHGKETMAIFDNKTGESIPVEDLMMEQSRSHVGFTPKLVAMISDPERSLELHHNHPSDTSFSGADISCVENFPGMKRIYAHGHGGSIYAVDSARPGASKAMKTADWAARKVFQLAITLRTIEIDAANALHGHAILTALDQAGAVSGYEATFPPEKTAMMEKYASIFSEAVAVAKTEVETFMKERAPK